MDTLSTSDVIDAAAEATETVPQIYYYERHLQEACSGSLELDSAFRAYPDEVWARRVHVNIGSLLLQVARLRVA